MKDISDRAEKIFPEVMRLLKPVYVIPVERAGDREIQRKQAD